MLYRFLKILIGIAIRLYYRRIKVTNQGSLNQKGPKIIISNHPNTLLDAWIVGSLCNEPIYYMAKGTFFNSPLRTKLLMSLGMIPINRSVDSKTQGVSNQDSFEMCYQLLEKGKTLLIFPEGNSFSERSLRLLKSGAARIALQTELRNNGNLGLKIIPVGLIYLQPEKFRSSVLAHVGNAIDPLPYLEKFKSNSRAGATALTEEFTKSMRELLVDSKSKEEETLSDQIISILSSNYLKSNPESGLNKDVSYLKEINLRINQISRKDPERFKEIEQLSTQLVWQIDNYQIKSDFLDRNFRFGMFMRQLLQSIFALILGLPLFLFGIIHNAFPYYFTDLTLPKIVQDIEYYAPVSILMGLVLYPLNYVGFILLVNQFIGLHWWQELIYFAIMPLMGLFAYYFYHYYKYINFKLSFVLLMNSRREAVEVLKRDRERLKHLIYEQE